VHAHGPAPELTPAQRRVLAALCRPLADGGAPASNRAIADELVVAVDTVKGTLSRLFEAFEIGDDVPQNQKRALLARRARDSGLIRD
jgi:DNA-binding NarL/FixJ family response regulator